MFTTINAKQRVIPKSPANPPARIKTILIIDVCEFKFGITNDAVAVRPIIIKSGADTKLLETAASPMKKHPL